MIKYTLNVSNLFLLLNIFLAFICIRIPYILNIPNLKFLILGCFFLGFIFGLFYCLINFTKVSLSLLLFIGCIFLHAFCNFYQPSLRSAISIQNYSFTNTITSDFLFTQTRLYLMYFILFMFPVATFFNSQREYPSNKVLNFFFIEFFFIVIINSVVSIYQSKVNIHFLAEESLTSIEAFRAPALLDDSGVASFFFAIFSGTFLSFVFLVKSSKFTKYTYFILFLLTAISGILNNSRSFYLGISAIIFFIFIINLIYYVKNLNFKSFLKITIAYSLITLISYIFYTFSNTTSIIRIKNSFKNITNDFSIISLYQYFDYERYKHLSILIENLKEHFYTGSGVGSFLGYIDYYAKKLNFPNIIPDVPTNLTLALFSELGVIVGSAILLISVIIFIIGVKHVFKNIEKNQNNNQLNVILNFSVLAMIPFLALSLTSYMIFVPSLAIIACFSICSPILILTPNQLKKFFTFLTWLIAFLNIYILGVCFYLAYNSSSIPQFKWQERGIPQFPVGIGKLPQTTENINKQRKYFSSFFTPSQFLFIPKGADQGRWLKPNTEILFKIKELRIYLGPETRHFPVTIKAIFYAKNGFSSNKIYNINEAGWIYLSLPENIEYNSCLEKIEEQSFCYARVNVSPNWKPDFLNSIGFFLEDRYTQ
ncbi:O-antigen ligase family protein [Pigmentibacter sp. JX0631]|uniref:O-antigen ligase family protein n=1 Tax=Pigmentibacter sp. JX0631 TaxID=2976982 RepID=UPI0024684BC6|nr:O-antigen ligase family protein [Pigmentibacter sp. JX0631]WGL58968.1 O-antigen ligase family protein [Pigmentibacter sp. JX0631]